MNPFTEGLYVIFRGNRYARRDVEGQYGAAEGGALFPYMNLVLPSTKNTHTQPFISPLSVSFGLEVCVMGWWRFYTSSSGQSRSIKENWKDMHFICK